MRIIFILISLLVSLALLGQDLNVVSWNLKDFGKSRDDQEISMIAEVVRNADVICIQEVVAKDPGGAKAVARLADELNRMGAKWDYRVTDPTGDQSPHKKERYAFLWKTSKVKLVNRIGLIKELDLSVCREPAIARFKFKNEIINILNYHACTHTKYYPEREEIKAITSWIQKNDADNLIWCGDMNLVIEDQAFKTAFEMGFESVLHGEKTSLKKTCNGGNYLSRAEDNVLYKLSTLRFSDFEILDFVGIEDCDDVSWKRNSFSDHLGVEIKIGS